MSGSSSAGTGYHFASKISWNCIDIGGGDYVAPLDSFSLVGIGIVKSSATSNDTVQSKLVEGHNDSNE